MKTLILTLLVLLAEGGETRERLDIEIPMRDGKALAADVFLSLASEPAPAVVIQTPYDKNHFREVIRGASGGRDSEVGRGSMSDMRVLADREHYAYVVVDWRGFFGSKEAAKGARRRDLGRDGYDVVEWVAAQPWCNGKVGTWGGSALGKAQLQTAVAKPPHLVCAVPLIAALGQRYAFYYEGGVYREGHNRTLDALGFGVSKVVKTAPKPDQLLWRIAEKKTYVPREIAVPCLMITGWWDHFPDEIIETFEDIVAKGGENARRHSKLLIGPWDHVSVGLAKQGEREFPGAALESARAAKAFLDHWLLGAENGWEKTPRIRYWRVNEEEWVAADSWSRRRRDEVTLHLSADGTIGSEPGRGTRDYLSDPAKPVPTLGGANLPPMKHGPTAHDALERRKDVLVFSTGKLAEPLRISGNVTLAFDFEADRPSLDVTAWLLEVRDGKSLHLADTARRVWDHDPDSEGRVTLEFPAVAATVDELKIYVSSTNWPRYERNPNDGSDHWDRRAAAPVKVTVHLAGSDLRIPVEPSE